MESRKVNQSLFNPEGHKMLLEFKPFTFHIRKYLRTKVSDLSIGTYLLSEGDVPGLLITNSDLFYFIKMFML